jgi:hypothetical protein
MLRTYLALALFAPLVPVASATSVFNFDNDAVGLSTPFTDTNNGISASFSSSVDPGGFTVAQSFFITLTGNVLLVPGPAGVANVPLDVKFDTTLKSASFDFALNASATTPILLQAYASGKLVWSGSALGSIPPTGFNFPEGHMSLNGVSFDSLVLSSPNAVNFAVDNVNVSTTASAVPEPASTSLVALFLILGACASSGWSRRVRYHGIACPQSLRSWLRVQECGHSEPRAQRPVQHRPSNVSSATSH